jgi:PTS system mannose-specific IIA component
MIKGLLIGHGKLPETLLEVVKSILGEVTDFAIVSNEGCSADELERCVNQASDQLGKGEKIVFVDLFGGSCAQVGNKLLARQGKIAVICGVNLPMLLKYFRYRERLKFDELVEIVKKAGEEEIKKIGT